MTTSQRPTSRVLAVLELLQSQPRLSGAELARRTGVDRRTVRRYIAHLVEIGIPVRAVRGRDGGYALRPGYKLPPMVFDAAEALALAIGLRAARELGLGGILPAVASAQSKLARVMPARLQRRIQDIDESVALQLGPAQERPFAAGAGSELLALSAAARAQQRVRLRYRGAGQPETERDVDVYGLAFRGGGWYAVGHCHLRRDLRSFRLDRVASVTALPQSFGRPAGFDVLAHLGASIASLPRSHAIEVQLLAEPAQARRAVPGAIATLEPRDGHVLMRAQADDLRWFANQLARLPFGFRIVRPAALRDALKALGQELIERAGQPPARSRRPRAR